MNEFKSNFSETIERVEQLALQAWNSLESFTGGMIHNIDQLGAKFTLAKMKLMSTMALMLGVMSACGTPPVVNNGETPIPPNGGTATTETQVPIISTLPAGIGETPGSSASATETPPPTESASTGSNSEVFVAPTIKDYENVASGDATVPDVLKVVEAEYRKSMENPTTMARVAEICAVDVSTLRVQYVEGSVGDQFRWMDVYVAKGPDGEDVVCWASVASTGELGEYPTYFDAGTKKVKSEESGISWERLTGKPDIFGTSFGLIKDDGYIVPGGMTGSDVGNEGNWSQFSIEGQTSEETLPVISPFSRENMVIVTDAGWSWNVKTGTLNDPSSNEILQFQDGILYDGEGNELEIDDLKFLQVNGVDENGDPMKLILERTVTDEQGTHTEIFVQKTNEWRSTVGYEPGSTTETDVMNYKPVTMEDIESGFLRELKLSQQYKWPSNTTTPDYYLAFVGGSRTGALELTIFGFDERLKKEYADRLAAGTGVTPILSPDMYRIQSPNDPNKWFPLGLSLQKGPNGEDLVFAGAYGSEYIASGEGGNTSLSFVGPGLRTTYLLGMDGNTCEGASLRGNIPYQAKLVSDSCAAFMPPGDEKWGRVSWDTILNGAEFGSTWESKPLDAGLLSQYQDDVLIAYNW